MTSGIACMEEAGVSVASSFQLDHVSSRNILSGIFPMFLKRYEIIIYSMDHQSRRFNVFQWILLLGNGVFLIIGYPFISHAHRVHTIKEIENPLLFFWREFIHN